MRPHVDELMLTAPEQVSTGDEADVEAELLQGSRAVPVNYPVSADWTGSHNLHVGSEWGIRPWHVATFDPETGTLVGLRPGTVNVEVTVNGVTEEAAVSITK